MSGLTDQDARALTFLACRIRKELHGAREWDEAGTYAVVAELIGHNLALTVERVTRHAADVEAKTPGSIRRPFLPDAPTAGPRFPAKAGTDCRTHPGEWADSCRACAADRIAGDVTPIRRPAPAPGRDTVAERVAELRRNVTPLRPSRNEPEEDPA